MSSGGCSRMANMRGPPCNVEVAMRARDGGHLDVLLSAETITLGGETIAMRRRTSPSAIGPQRRFWPRNSAIGGFLSGADILILDAETGDIVDVNPFLIKLLGLSRAFLGKKLWEIGTFKDVLPARKNSRNFRMRAVRYDNLPLQTVGS